MTISRGSTALLLLDLQRDFLDRDGVHARHGPPVHRLRGIIPTIARVAAADVRHRHGLDGVPQGAGGVNAATLSQIRFP